METNSNQPSFEAINAASGFATVTLSEGFSFSHPGLLGRPGKTTSLPAGTYGVKAFDDTSVRVVVDDVTGYTIKRRDCPAAFIEAL